MNEWCRGGGCNLNIQHDDTLSSPIAPTVVGNSILGVLIFKDQQVDFHIASWFPAGMSAMVWTPGYSQSHRHGRHWWWSWCCAPITLKSMVWWEWRWPGSEPPITPIVSGLCSGLTVACSLIPAVQHWDPSQGTSNHLASHWEVRWSVGTNPDYGNWMASMQVGWNKHSQAPLVQCVLWWCPGQLTTCLHLGLWIWH